MKSKNYFKESSEEKSEYAIHTEKAGGINRGWVAMQGESLDPEGTKVKRSSLMWPMYASCVLHLSLYFVCVLLNPSLLSNLCVALSLSLIPLSPLSLSLQTT